MFSVYGLVKRAQLIRTGRTDSVMVVQCRRFHALVQGLDTAGWHHYRNQLFGSPLCLENYEVVCSLAQYFDFNDVSFLCASSISVETLFFCCTKQQSFYTRQFRYDIFRVRMSAWKQYVVQQSARLKSPFKVFWRGWKSAPRVENWYI